MFEISSIYFCRKLINNDKAKADIAFQEQKLNDINMFMGQGEMREWKEERKRKEKRYMETEVIEEWLR